MKAEQRNVIKVNRCGMHIEISMLVEDSKKIPTAEQLQSKLNDFIKYRILKLDDADITSICRYVGMWFTEICPKVKFMVKAVQDTSAGEYGTTLNCSQCEGDKNDRT